MSSGGEILEAIDRGLGRLRRDTETLDEQFRRAGAELAAAQHAELTVFARLARLRVHGIASGELLQCLDDTDRQVGEILKIRRAAEASLADGLASAERALAAAESERARQQPIVAAAAQAADAAAKEAKARLDAHELVAAQLAAARAAQAVAEHAEAKAAAAEGDRVDKCKAFDADPVFAYLWRRGYGTAAYRSRPAIRMLDGWVARGSGYETLRRDYWLLQEIPRRLAEHAKRMRAKANESLSAARALETEAAEAAGVPAAERALADAEQRLAEIDRAVAEHEAAVDTEIERRARYAAGEDEYSTRCTALLTQAFQRNDMQDLRKRAARTGTDEDDRLIDELERLEQERLRLQQNLIQLRRLHQTQRERTLGLEDVRRRFKQSRFDDARSQFVNAALIETLLDRFVVGAIGADELWTVMGRQQRRLE